MRAEYLIFNLLVGAPIVLLLARERTRPILRLRSALTAIVVAAVPFIAWDAAVRDDHWWFEPRYTLGPTLGGLPVEEWLFFASVPLACLYTWEAFFCERGRPPRVPPRRWAPLVVVVAALGAGILSSGPAYSGLVVLAVAGFLGLDGALGTGLVRSRRFFAFAAVVAVLTLVFNGYLTARPVVHYSALARSGLQLWTVPAEDFAYAIALVGSNVALYQWLEGRGAPLVTARGLIERRLGGFHQRFVEPDRAAPKRLGPNRRVHVAVIGGGLAGITAASELAQRGFDVELLEREPHIGGKVGAWCDRLSDGTPARVEHGFHAFFYHYYNLREFLQRAGATSALREIDDYVILLRDGERLRFRGTSTVAVLNLLSLWRAGLFRMLDVARPPTGPQLEALLRYEPTSTFAEYDGTSFERWADNAEIPTRLRLIFTSFARAFFADEDRVSMAELIKSFHFYYLSHDQGLRYEYIEGDYETGLLAPLRRHLIRAGVTMRTGRAVRSIAPRGAGLNVDGEVFDYVVLATDVAAARKLVLSSDPLRRACPTLSANLAKMRPGQRYAVLRVWLDRKLVEDLPVFVVVQRIRVLDAITQLDRIDPACRRDAPRGGCVLELHSYAVPDDVADEDIRASLLVELGRHVPELANATAVKFHEQIRSDFTAFYVGMAQHRPVTTTEHTGLQLAGDWVKLPVPAMLMEAACTSGLLAANAIFEREGLCASPVATVPRSGVLARRRSRAAV